MTTADSLAARIVDFGKTIVGCAGLAAVGNVLPERYNQYHTGVYILTAAATLAIKTFDPFKSWDLVRHNVNVTDLKNTVLTSILKIREYCEEALGVGSTQEAVSETQPPISELDIQYGQCMKTLQTMVDELNHETGLTRLSPQEIANRFRAINEIAEKMMNNINRLASSQVEDRDYVVSNS